MLNNLKIRIFYFYRGLTLNIGHFLISKQQQKNTKKCHKNTNLSDKRTPAVAKIQNNICCCGVSGLNMQIILSNISRRKSFMLILKGFLFFQKLLFSSTTLMTSSLIVKSNFENCSTYSQSIQNINQIIVRIVFALRPKLRPQ